MKEESEKVGLKLNIQKTKIMASGPHHFMVRRQGNSGRLNFSGLQNHCRWWLQPWNWKMLTPWKESYDWKLDSILKSRDIILPAKVHLVKAMVCVSEMWELDHKESWALKNWCFWALVLEKTLESPLDSKEIQPVRSKRDRSWVFIGRTDVEAETPMLWPPDAKNWLIWNNWCWDRLRAGGEGDNRGSDGWMASPTQ